MICPFFAIDLRHRPSANSLGLEQAVGMNYMTQATKAGLNLGQR